MERVSIIEGKEPVIFVAPHGADDTNTGLIAETAAEELKAYAVINRGFKRSKTFDYSKEHADCNNITHCHEDVVKDEFLDPILRFNKRIKKKYTSALILTIHGVGNKILSKTPDVGYILGFGKGRPPRYTCLPWMKDWLVHFLNQTTEIAYEAKAGSPYAGWGENNLNQLFRHWYSDNSTFSIQIEIIRRLRATRGTASLTGTYLALCVEELLEKDGTSKLPSEFEIKKI